jgi:myo-inositol 2-dehydrogenase / D-chiro-inositol 1-dehydrogenase
LTAICAEANDPDMSMNHSPTPQQNRREFLKSSSTVLATATIASPFILSREARAAANSDTLKFGLVGCGGRGSGAASQALHADPNVHLTAVGDLFPDQIKRSLDVLKTDKETGTRVQVDAEHQFTGLDAFQQVINSGVDVVLLATPPGFRPQHLRAAIEAGKHVFCEKPMATDAPGVRSVMESVRLSKQKNLAIVAGFCWRYDYARREFFKRVHDGAMGDVRSMHATYLTGPVKPMPAPDRRPAGMGDVEWQCRNWYNFVWICGDGLVEQACHSVDKIAWAFKDVPPLKCVGNGGRQTPNHEGNIYDHIDVFYEWEDGARATMAQRQIPNCYSDNSDYLLGTLGNGTIKGYAPPTITGQNRWRYTGEKPDMYQVEHNELFASIRSGKHINDGDWMAKSTLMAIMGRMAAYTGQEVTWEQALNSKWSIVPENLTWDQKLPIDPIAIPGRTKLV